MILVKSPKVIAVEKKVMLSVGGCSNTISNCSIRPSKCNAVK